MNPPASLVPVSIHTQEIGESQDLLTLLPDSSALAWVRGGDGLVGWGEFDRIEVTGADRFEKIRLWWRERCAHFTICLLYTSPSPRDYAASRMPSSA